MADTQRKRQLVVIRHSPYGSSLARAALDAALAAAAFDQPVDLLFMGDGVLQLLPDQQSEGLGVKNIGRLLASLPLYGIEQVYADADAVARFGLDLGAAPVPARAVDDTAMRQLLGEYDHLLGF